MKKDWMNTFHWANQAAALDNETGMIDLGMMHLYGNGTSVNHDEGLRWLVKAYEKKAAGERRRELSRDLLSGDRRHGKGRRVV